MASLLLSTAASYLGGFDQVSHPAGDKSVLEFHGDYSAYVLYGKKLLSPGPIFGYEQAKQFFLFACDVQTSFCQFESSADLRVDARRSSGRWARTVITLDAFKGDIK
jgi:hypothetical protein